MARGHDKRTRSPLIDYCSSPQVGRKKTSDATGTWHTAPGGVILLLSANVNCKNLACGREKGERALPVDYCNIPQVGRKTKPN